MKQKKVVIAGAAGRDFHNFLTYYKNNSNYKVIAFTATQIPYIDDKKFPKELAGKKYSQGIPIIPEKQLPNLIKKHDVDDVVLSYSDLPYDYVMHFASKVQAAGANFIMLGPKDTMIKSKKPVVSVTAVRTGCGKSQTTRKVADTLKLKGKKVIAIRHPMPYGDLVKQKVQRFATFEDLIKHKTTIEEQEEYQPWIDRGMIIYAGVDYEAILKQAEKEADIILFDGGNNDFSFYKPDLNIVVVDPHRPGHEIKYYPGEINLRMADVIVINKIKTALKKNVEIVINNIKKYNPKAKIIKAESEIIVDKPELIRGKRVLLIGDGPTLTHGGMRYSAATVAAKKYRARKIINAKKHAVGTLKETYKKYPHVTYELPAMGYSKKQLKDLEMSVNKSKCDVVIDGSPADLKRLIKINKPIVKVKYELKEIGIPNLNTVLTSFLRKKK